MTLIEAGTGPTHPTGPAGPGPGGPAGPSPGGPPPPKTYPDPPPPDPEPGPTRPTGTFPWPDPPGGPDPNPGPHPPPPKWDPTCPRCGGYFTADHPHQARGLHRDCYLSAWYRLELDRYPRSRPAGAWELKHLVDMGWRMEVRARNSELLAEAQVDVDGRWMLRRSGEEGRVVAGRDQAETAMRELAVA